ncbi:MAG TPA: GGDEF domain-containing protein [Woeseiaceae bacterium]|nr:GGDEF domain-containing protein [Woeseiaceae bacterium]
MNSPPKMATCVDVPDGPQQLASARCEIDALVRLSQALQEQVTRLNDALARTSRFAFHDELTGLPNRRLLKDHFGQAVARAIRASCEIVLVFIDLNEFKGVNEEFGHVAGDGLLQQVAGRLQSCLRTTDTACRFGGDEFVLLLPDISARPQATAAIERIIAELAIPYAIDRTRISVTASVGMAIYPQDGKSYRELLTLADFTMFSDKPSSAPAESLSAHAHLQRKTRSAIR